MPAREKVLESQLSMVLMLLVAAEVFHRSSCVKGAISLIVAAAIFPWFARSAYIVWTSSLKAVEFVFSRLLLALMFYIVVTPVAVLFRLFHKDHLKLKDNGLSLWQDRSKDVKKEDFIHPW